MEKVWEIKNPEEYLKGNAKNVRRQGRPREERDPAAAYSRSIFAWGLGQLYNDQVVKGAVFMVLMVLAAFCTVLGAIYCGDIHQFLLRRGISRSRVFLAAESALFLTILLWISNAADAYRVAARTRTTPFPGVPSRITPLLGSLLVPGWGQFLNGQPVKGSLFSVIAIITGFSVCSVAFTSLSWPLLDAGDARFLVEGIATVCLFLVPLAPLVWTLSVYDAFKVSRDDLLKEPFWERVKAAYYRGRTQGWVRGVFPQIKATFLLILLLAFLLLVDHYLIPQGYYARQLTAAQALLQGRGMTIVPELIGRALEVAGWK